MYAHMLENPKVGGVCGYMQLRIENVHDNKIKNDANKGNNE